MNDYYKHSEITDIIIKGFYNVYNTLGYGFLEKVCENALALELENFGFRVEKQVLINVSYLNTIVGNYFADLVVNNEIIIEVKASDCLVEANEAQLTNYLKASKMEVGLLLNFGKKPEIKRKVFSNKE